MGTTAGTALTQAIGSNRLRLSKTHSLNRVSLGLVMSMAGLKPSPGSSVSALDAGMHYDPSNNYGSNPNTLQSGTPRTGTIWRADRGTAPPGCPPPALPREPPLRFSQETFQARPAHRADLPRTLVNPFERYPATPSPFLSRIIRQTSRAPPPPSPRRR